MVLIIGGNPCSGKSSISEKLGKLHHLKVIDSDRLLERYVMNATSDMKRLYEWKSTPMLEILQKPSEQLFSELLDFYQEALSLFLSETYTEDIIFEGAFFTPEVCEQLKVECPVVYLLSTNDFYLEKYPQRSYAKEMKNTEYGAIALQNLMKRDMLFRDYVYQTANQRGYKIIDIDTQTNFDAVLESVNRILSHKS